MKKLTRLSIQWFYDLLDQGECDIMDLKEQFEDKNIFGKSQKNFSPNYEEMARDVVAFANKKGGFLFIGIADKTKEINHDFICTNDKLFDLIRQIQDRTQPSVTLVPHRLIVEGAQLLVLEIPFSRQIHCTSKGEYIIRSNDGNKAIEPHEMATIMAEKNLIVYDQRTWKVSNWQDEERTQMIRDNIRKARVDSPLIQKSNDDFKDALNFEKEDNGDILPTTTGILLAGNDKALKEIPFSQIKYVRYAADGSYQPYEWRGNLIEIVDGCFAQLKSEIQTQEFSFGLFHEFVEDYSEVVLRELLVNAVVHRDYSRQQIIEIRKYPTFLEIESPGHFPDGVDVTNFLRKTNPRNPSIIDVFREMKYAEKAGSGFDKIFTDLLSKGKKLPLPTETSTSVVFRVEAEMYSNKLMELSVQYKQMFGKDMDIDKLLVLNAIISNKKMSLADLEDYPFISREQLKRVLDELIDLEYIETTGRTSGLKYILHKSKNKTTSEKIKYSKLKKQEKARQKEAILRYLDEVETITNAEARMLLQLPDSSRSYVSRLLSSMVESEDLEIITPDGVFKRIYRRKH